MLTGQLWIDALRLEPHVVSGFFRRTFQAGHLPPLLTERGKLHLLTSIHYLLTEASPVGYWHLNRSDILHFHHSGAPSPTTSSTPTVGRIPLPSARTRTRGRF